MAQVMVFGCGYVGSALARRLMAGGHRVGAVTRNAERAEALRALGVEPVVEACLEDGGAWMGALGEGWTVAVSTVSAASPDLEGYRRSYLAGNGAVLAWVKAAGVGVRLYTSATSVYPQSDGRWVAEDAVGEEGELSANGQILRASERAWLDEGIAGRAVVLRLAGIYGPGRHLFVNQLRAGVREFGGCGESYLNLIHCEDAAASLAHGIERAELSGVYNVVDDEPAQRGEIIGWLAGRLGVGEVRFTGESGARGQRRRSVYGAPNRRVSNARMRATGWRPQYENYRSGYSAILGDAG